MSYFKLQSPAVTQMIINSRSSSPITSISAVQRPSIDPHAGRPHSGARGPRLILKLAEALSRTLVREAKFCPPASLAQFQLAAGTRENIPRGLVYGYTAVIFFPFFTGFWPGLYRIALLAAVRCVPGYQVLFLEGCRVIVNYVCTGFDVCLESEFLLMNGCPNFGQVSNSNRPYRFQNCDLVSNDLCLNISPDDELHETDDYIEAE